MLSFLKNVLLTLTVKCVKSKCFWKKWNSLLLLYCWVRKTCIYSCRFKKGCHLCKCLHNFPHNYALAGTIWKIEIFLIFFKCSVKYVNGIPAIRIFSNKILQIPTSIMLNNNLKIQNRLQFYFIFMLRSYHSYQRSLNWQIVCPYLLMKLSAVL